MTEAQRKMILDWMRKIHQLEYAHRYDSIAWSKSEKHIGISAFAISTLVVFSYQFPSIAPAKFNCLWFIFKQSFFVPFASIIVAILTGLQTFLKPGEKSELHKRTASNYEQLRHRIELILTFGSLSSDLESRIDAIKEEWDKLESINVRDRYFQQGKSKANSFNKYPKELDFLDDVK